MLSVWCQYQTQNSMVLCEQRKALLHRCMLQTHGYLKGKIRMRKSVQDDRIYVVKTLKSIDESGVTIY